MIRVLILLVLSYFAPDFMCAQGSANTFGLSQPASGYEPDIAFDHLTEKDGLSYKFCTDILQDRDGILWIASTFGLNRYDGKRFDVLRHNRKLGNSLIHNTISAITEDQAGNIWGATGRGIFCYNKSNHSFRNFHPKDSTKYPGINAIVCDRNNQIWAGSYEGLVKINEATHSFEFLTADASNPYSISSNHIRRKGLANDPSGRGLWVATDKGLNFFDLRTQKFTNANNTRDSSVFNNRPVGALHISKTGLVWMFDDLRDEIIGFKDYTQGILHRISVKGYIQDPYGGCIFETSDHQLWYSSESYEIVRIRYLSQLQYDRVRHDDRQPESIGGDWILGAWEDKDKTIWFLTSAGISRFNPNRAFYATVKLADKFPELGNNWQITCLVQNPYDETWCCGSRNGKVYVVEPQTKQCSVIDFSQMIKGPSPRLFITDIDFVNGQMILCFSRGLTYQYDLKLKVLQPFKPFTGKYANFYANTMSMESDSTYIIGNNGRVPLRWNIRTGALEELVFRELKSREGYFHTTGWLKASKGKGTWFAATNDVVGYIHPGAKVVETMALKIGMRVLSDGFVTSLEVDALGNAWFCHEGHGLYQVKKLKEHVREVSDIKLYQWDSSDGLVNEHVQSSVADNQGRIWVSSANKFSVFDPKKQSFFNFQIPLSESNSFFYNYLIPLKNGQMLTNIMGSLVQFYPERIKISPPQNAPLISSVELPNRKIYLDGSRRVELEPHENFISIAFGSLSDQQYFDYHFEYLLDGVNTDWVTADKNAVATFSDLWPGTYTFRLKAKSTDGNWSSEEKRIQIHIKAPFYKTWWFFALILILLAAIIYRIAKARLVRLQKMNALEGKAQLLEKEKTVVMYENLKQHLNPHFLFNSLASLGSLIRLDPRQAGEFLDKMSKVYRYILKNKDNETVPLAEELKFVGLYNQLQQTRFGEGLQIVIDIPEAFHHRKIAPVTLQNLVENAIKHNIADEESPLVIRMSIEDDYLVVQNNLQKKNYVETSNKQGQLSMVNLYQFLTGRPVKIVESETHYTISIPLI